MNILKPAKAGTLESNDISIMLMPHDNGIEIELESVVEKQFGTEIRLTIENKLKELGIENIVVKAIDKGALDYTIKARIETAVVRAGVDNA